MKFGGVVSRLRPVWLTILKIKFPHSAQDWNVIAARLVLVAGALDTLATFTGHLSPKIGSVIGGAAGVILAVSQAVQTPAGILRPAQPTATATVEKIEVAEPGH